MSTASGTLPRKPRWFLSKEESEMAYPRINRAKFIDIPSLLIMGLAVALPAVIMIAT